MGLSGYHNCEDGASQKEAEIQDNPVREKYAIEQTQFFSLMDDINVSEKYAILQIQLSSYQLFMGRKCRISPPPQRFFKVIRRGFQKQQSRKKQSQWKGGVNFPTPPPSRTEIRIFSENIVFSPKKSD